MIRNDPPWDIERAILMPTKMLVYKIGLKSVLESLVEITGEDGKSEVQAKLSEALDAYNSQEKVADECRR